MHSDPTLKQAILRVNETGEVADGRFVIADLDECTLFVEARALEALLSHVQTLLDSLSLPRLLIGVNFFASLSLSQSLIIHSSIYTRAVHKELAKEPFLRLLTYLKSYCIFCKGLL